MNIIGNVERKSVLIIDDIADTCGTLLEAARILMNNGAKSISAGIVHLIAPKRISEKLKDSNITKLIVTNSISDHIDKVTSNIQIIEIDISDYLSRCILWLHYYEGY